MVRSTDLRRGGGSSPFHVVCSIASSGKFAFTFCMRAPRHSSMSVITTCPACPHAQGGSPYVATIYVRIYSCTCGTLVASTWSHTRTHARASARTYAHNRALTVACRSGRREGISSEAWTRQGSICPMSCRHSSAWKGHGGRGPHLSKHAAMQGDEGGQAGDSSSQLKAAASLNLPCRKLSRAALRVRAPRSQHSEMSHRSKQKEDFEAGHSRITQPALAQAHARESFQQMAC